MPLRLQFTADSRLPIDLAGIVPERTRGKSFGEVERLEIFRGNRRLPLAELFSVAGDPADGEIHLSGDLTSVHFIGACLAEGTIRIEGSAGRHLGAEMRGGHIEVFGDAGDWLGAELHGGRIRVHGNAADHAACAYPGSPRGVTGGELLIDGGAGDQLGTAMRRGLVAVGGAAGDGVGTRMIAGTILIGGRCGRHTGAGMRRGTIVLRGPAGEMPGSKAAQTDSVELLPTFARANRWNPQFMRLLLVHLQRVGFLRAGSWMESDYAVYHGDQLARAHFDRGKGEILVRV
jgi:formylmethanofuran dehydrogenase subunit C